VARVPFEPTDGPDVRTHPSIEEPVMAGKTPQKPAAKKAGKSLKEKREAKNEKKKDKRIGE
jgi:hypothetical protein